MGLLEFNMLERILKAFNRSSDRWGLANVLLRLLTPFLFLPILVRTLDSRELGVWYLMLNVCAFVGTLEVGVSGTVSRIIGLFYGGAEGLKKHGFIAGTDSSPNVPAIEKVIPTSRIISLSLTCAIALGLIFVLPWVKGRFGEQFGNLALIEKLFWLSAVMMVATVLSGHAGGIVVGLNRQERILQRNFYLNILQSGGGAVAILAGGGILTLAIIYAVAALATWVWNEWTLHQCCSELGINLKSFTFDDEIYRSLRPTWMRNTAVYLGGFFITQAGILVSSSILGLEEAARWGLTMQVIGAVTGICQIGLTSIAPEISVLRGSGNSESLLRLFGKRLRVSLFLFTLGGGVILVGGDWGLGLIGAKTHLLSTGLLAWMLIMQLLEFNHSAHASLVLSGNHNPFACLSLVSGIAILLLSYFFGKKWGLGGLIFSRFIVQATVANWWPILLAARALHMKTTFYLTRVYGISLSVGRTE